MDKRFNVSTQVIESCDGDVDFLLSKGEFWRITISEAECERCSGRVEQAMHNCRDVVLRVYLLGVANAFHALHEVKREDDEDSMLNRVMMMWHTDTGDYTEEWLRRQESERGGEA